MSGMAVATSCGRKGVRRGATEEKSFGTHWVAFSGEVSLWLPFDSVGYAGCMELNCWYMGKWHLLFRIQCHNLAAILHERLSTDVAFLQYGTWPHRG